jgi:hypothetical protein
MTNKDLKELNGRFLVGPFRIPAEDVLYEMDRYGLFTCEAGRDPEIVNSIEGIRLRAHGPEVWSYFIDEDGREADKSLIDAFFIATTQPGEEFTMSGSHALDERSIVVLSARGSHDGQRVTWQENRVFRTNDLILNLKVEDQASDSDLDYMS